LDVLSGLIYPFAVSNAVKPNIHTAIFTIVVNGKTGELEMEFANVSKSADFTYVQKSNLYYIFQQIKNEPQNEKGCYSLSNF
jgi:hypothetical protein